MEVREMDNEAIEHGGVMVEITVNDKPVKILGNTATGEQIKVAAIEQGVHIERDFILWEELPDGDVREIENHEEVKLREHHKFTAVPRERHEVTVLVNEMPVKLAGHTATGAQIKAAAIAQGVAIQPNFVLQEELPNGKSRVVGDNDRVHLRNHLKFTAIAPDDNS
jgi:hypothetical protein